MMRVVILSPFARDPKALPFFNKVAAALEGGIGAEVEVRHPTERHEEPSFYLTHACLLPPTADTPAISMHVKGAQISDPWTDACVDALGKTPPRNEGERTALFKFATVDLPPPPDDPFFIFTQEMEQTLIRHITGYSPEPDPHESLIDPDGVFFLDLDGTIANPKYRLHYLDSPLSMSHRYSMFYRDDNILNDVLIAGAEIVDSMLQCKWNVFFLTSRPAYTRAATEKWLSLHFKHFDKDTHLVLMQPNGSRSPSADFKKSVLAEYRKDHEDTLIYFVDDDESNRKAVGQLSNTRVFSPGEAWAYLKERAVFEIPVKVEGGDPSVEVYSDFD